MAFLESTIRRNPKLIEAAIALHQEGKIPANSFVLDQDVFHANMSAVKDEAERVGINVYFMTKQHGRNPLVFGPPTADGRAKTVAVDMQCAKALHYNGIPLGHVGNLSQVPNGELDAVVGEMQPEVMSVFTVEKAEAIAAAAARADRTQDILLRVRRRKEDLVLPGMEGGFELDELPDVVKRIGRLGTVRIVGVTTFPALNLGNTEFDPAPNFETLRMGAQQLSDLGVNVTQINAPGNTTTHTLQRMADEGATHVEPGSGLAGHATYHLVNDDLPERPALVYVTEISHFVEGKAWVFGGGFFLDDPPVSDLSDFDGRRSAIVGRDAGALDRRVPFLGTGTAARGAFGSLDYHGLLDVDRSSAAVGDTVVFGFRTQAFDTRANVAVVRNCETDPEVLGVFDVQGHRYDDRKWW
jgi:predicted amino acid racemase